MKTAQVPDPHPVDRSSAHTDPAKQNGHALHSPETSRAISHLLSLNESAAPAQQTAQLAPNAFANLAVLNLNAKTGPFRTSYWTPIKAAVQAYSQLQANNHKERKRLLREMGIMAERWRKARGLPQKQINELDQAEQNKANALIALEQQMVIEYGELGGGHGALNVNQPQMNAVVNSPLLTVGRKEKDKRQRAFFIGNTNIVNAQGNVVGQGNANVVCRAIPDKGAPQGQQADNYFWVRPAPDDDLTLNGGQVQNFTPGYVRKDAVIPIGLESFNNNFEYEDRTSQSMHPLFVGAPSVDDVRQSKLGNCYLLAAILAVVRATPNHFVNHMIDHGNGVVTVRLYEKNGMNYQARDIHIRKSEAIVKGSTTEIGEAYNKSALWVQILEKAYAAAGFSGTSAETMPQGFYTTYSQIASGLPAVALAHLTGQVATSQRLDSSDPDDKKPLDNWLAFGGNVGVLTYLQNNHGGVRMEFMGVADAMGAALAQLANTKDALRIGDITNFINNYNITPGLRLALLAYVGQENMYPGKRGTGIYSASQRTAMAHVVDAIDNHQFPVANSRSYMKRNSNDRSGQSGGENVHGGLAGPHGYEIIDYRPANYDPQNPPPNTLCWIKIRNPWGNTGRGYRDSTNHGTLYDENNQNPVANMEDYKIDDPEFWIPLEDLTKRFSSITYV